MFRKYAIDKVDDCRQRKTPLFGSSQCHKHLPSITCFFIVACFTFGITTFAEAAQYSLDYGIDLSALYDDNVRLDESEDSLEGGTLSPQFSLEAESAISSLRATGSAEFNQFNQDPYNSNDFQFGLNYNRRFERGSAGLGINYSRDSTRSVEADEDGSGEIGFEATRVETQSANFNLARNVSEKDIISWSGSGRERRYESINFSDFDSVNTSLAWQHFLTSRLSTSLTISYLGVKSESDGTLINPDLELAALIAGRDLQAVLETCSQNIAVIPPFFFTCEIASVIENEQQDIGFQFGFNYSLNENWELGFFGGRSRVDTERSEMYSEQLLLLQDRVIEADRYTDSYSFGLNYLSPRLRHSFSAAQNNGADSFGRLILSERARWEMNWDASEYSSWRTRLSWSDREASDGTDSGQQSRESWLALIRYAYRFSPEWYVALQFTHQQSNTGGGDGETNRMLLTLEWRPTTLKWSR